MGKAMLDFDLNGSPVRVEVSTDALLIDVLRDDLKLTGTKRGCGSGDCGACTVLVNGEPVASCIYPAPKVQGKKVLTVEGLGNGTALHPLQKHFLGEGAVQCGYCTPGMLMSAKALLDKNCHPAEKEILGAISGNLCRCTGYKKIVRAVEKAAMEIRGEDTEGTAKKALEPGAVGSSAPRKEGVSKVTGRALYAADMHFPGMIFAVVLRSGIPHALIRSIDTSGATGMPGVVAVFTARDISKSGFGTIKKDRVMLAGDRVRYIGEPVALVAAETKQVANAALKMISVEYEPLPVVTDPLEAMSDGAPQIHPGGNILMHRKVYRGDVEEGFRRSHVIIEDIFTTQVVEHAYLETEAAVALMDGETVVVYGGSQGVHHYRREIAGVLGLPLSRVRVVQTTTGGAFGAKIDVSAHPYAALASFRTGRPVKMVYSREESFAASVKRHPYTMNYKVGVDREGRLVAAQVKLVGDAGAYATNSPALLTRSAVLGLGPYTIPHIRIDAYAVHTNNLVSGAMRGFGVPQVTIAYESMMDCLAEKLGLSPVEIRRRNILTAGSVTHTGQVLKHSVGIGKTLEEAARSGGMS